MSKPPAQRESAPTKIDRRFALDQPRSVSVTHYSDGAAVLHIMTAVGLDIVLNLTREEAASFSDILMPPKRDAFHDQRLDRHIADYANHQFYSMSWQPLDAPSVCARGGIHAQILPVKRPSYPAGSGRSPSTRENAAARALIPSGNAISSASAISGCCPREVTALDPRGSAARLAGKRLNDSVSAKQQFRSRRS
ncbi:hypothetical protein GXW78_09835 [Roseomonas terrae]|uniref:Uncharacterized protein n=1 Tax=Neoroseomonas terrae TaxID=424799 RepID=A0ABS5EG08_9PROT|nr:hypothetical protein [Neoroseomonas terrae]MBR0649963.1 hypothetical protein [Neoroseomonas terrae]